MSSDTRVRPDETPPNNPAIFIYAVLAIVSLFALKFGFDSYLERARHGVRREQLADSDASEVLESYRESSRAALANGRGMPIDEAMRQLATRGREGFIQVRPFQSSDTGARTGWARLPLSTPVETPEPELAAIGH